MHDFTGCQPCYQCAKKLESSRYPSGLTSRIFYTAETIHSRLPPARYIYPRGLYETTFLTVAEDLADMPSNPDPQSQPFPSTRGSSRGVSNSQWSKESDGDTSRDSHRDNRFQGNGEASGRTAGPGLDSMEEWEEWEEEQEEVTDYYGLLNLSRDVLSPFLKRSC